MSEVMDFEEWYNGKGCGYQNSCGKDPKERSRIAFNAGQEEMEKKHIKDVQDLTKAKELLKTYKGFIEYEGLSTRLGKTYDKTVQFLKEIGEND